MDISIRDLGGCRRELAVVVPASEVDAELEKAFDGVRGQVSLPGFRQGKVPRALIEKKFGPQLKEDVANELVGKAVEKAVKDHALELVSQPEIETPRPRLKPARTSSSRSGSRSSRRSTCPNTRASRSRRPLRT